MKPDVRQPAAAGHFYPEDPTELRRMVEELLESVSPVDQDADAPPPKAIIAPHAGYVYSGPTAAAACSLYNASGRSDQPSRLIPSATDPEDTSTSFTPSRLSEAIWSTQAPIATRSNPRPGCVSSALPILTTQRDLADAPDNSVIVIQSLEIRHDFLAQSLTTFTGDRGD